MVTVFIGANISFGLDLFADINLSLDISVPHLDCHPLKEVLMKLFGKKSEVMGHTGGA